ncbi:MAG: ABC transporter ATP-binding protein [Bacilli bacterium]|nr:ABC transporter ATP-binding protein [Bacilli bacterium]
MKKTALGQLRKNRLKVILAPIFKLFECVCELLVPLLVKRIIDYIADTGTIEPDLREILWPCLIMLALAILGFGVTMITQYLAARVSADYAYDLKKDIYAQINSLSENQIERFGKSKTLTIINNDSFSLQVGVNMFMRALVRAPFLIIGTIVTSFLLSVQAGLITLGVLLLSSLVVFLVMGLTPKRYQAIQSELDHLSTIGEDNLSGARVVRAFHKEEQENARFQEASSSYQKKAFALSKISAFLNPLTFFFVNLGIIFVIYLSGYHQAESGITIGTAVALLTYFAQAMAALVLFSRFVTSLSTAAASKKRIDSFLALEPEIVDGPEEAKPFSPGESIYDLQGASLSYGGEELALQNIDFSLKEGDHIGVIGGTGSGKSSLISLLERFLDPASGKILYQGKPMKDFKVSGIRKNIALVSQKPQLYHGSIRSNLLFGNPDATEEEIQEALQDSLASEFVSRYEDGLDHIVEEGGMNHSGGQKQRLLLARALLSKRPILILDDATSALDYKIDAEVRKNIKKRGLTTLIISQRATSIMDMDAIYVFDAGKVVAKGTHEELLSSCAIYREIYETQVAAS